MNKHVSLALNLSDGFLNRPVKSFSGIHFTLDGLEAKPVLKTEGWCIFINMPIGTHTLRVTSHAFATYVLEFEITDSELDSLEVYHTLAPTKGYLFGRRVFHGDVTAMMKKQPLAEASLYITGEKSKALKLAQDTVQPGERQFHLFSEQPVQLLNLPGQYLIADGEKTEVLSLVQLEEDGRYLAAEPMRFTHARGAVLLPVQEYLTDTSGGFFLAQKDSGKAVAYWLSPEGYLQANIDLEQTPVTAVFRAGGKKNVNTDSIG